MVIDLQAVSEEHLPEAMAMSVLTLAEPSAGPHATIDPAERARRQDRLQLS
jgi:hypothetical protein